MNAPRKIARRRIEAALDTLGAFAARPEMDGRERDGERDAIALVRHLLHAYLDEAVTR